jgi:hypothetical protein
MMRGINEHAADLALPVPMREPVPVFDYRRALGT